MRHKLYLCVLVAASLISASGSALAQNAGAAAVGAQTAPGVGTTPPVGMPANPTTTGTGSGSAVKTGGINQPGVPNTSTPGIIGTGASPSGLPGDDPAQPGFPRKVGR